MKKLILLLIFLCFNFYSYSQIDASLVNINSIPLNKEKTHLETNTDYLFAGEYLYYKFFTFLSKNNTLSDLSKIGYVELIDADKNKLFTHKLSIKNSTAEGRFFIPTNIKTGNYKIIAYTNWTKNNATHKISTHDLVIINPYSANKQEIQTPTDTIKIKKKKLIKLKKIEEPGISISTDKKEYTKRCSLTIDINISTIFKNGNYSLSIRKIDSVEITKNKKTNTVAKTDSNAIVFHIPELRGELISGEITNTKTSGDISNKNVSLSIPGKDPFFKIVQTNSEGQFFFSLDETFSDDICFFEILETDKNHFTLKLDNKEYSEYENITLNTISLDPNLKNSITERSIKNQITNAYYSEEKKPITTKKTEHPFYYQQGMDYFLDDYTRFKTIEETFVEIIQLASIRKEKDDFLFTVYNYSRTNENLKPLILIDGAVITNNDDLIYYDPYSINKITIIEGEYYFGVKLFDGIIAVSTFLGNFKPKKFMKKIKLTNLNSKIKYAQPDYSKNTNKRIPDYRRQLLWESNLNIENNSSSLQTYTSDEIGIYEILLQGYTKNGEFVKANHFIEVK